MKKTHPILGANYRPSWMQGPNYLARRFAAIRKEQAEAAKLQQQIAQEKILKVRAMK